MAHELAEVKGIDHPDSIEGEAQTVFEGDELAQEEWLSLPLNLRSEVHPKPSRWRIQPGWTRYPILRDPTSNEDNSPLSAVLGEGYSVPFPLEEDGALTFDVETMPKLSPYPVMATAICRDAWYSWLSPWLLNEGEGKERMDHLISFSSNLNSQEKPARLLVGHNVSFDRARILDEYSLTRSSIRFLDTMSLHVATRGISSPQRPAWVNHSKDRALKKAQKILKQEEVREETKRALRAALGLRHEGEVVEEGDDDLLKELDLDLKALGIGDSSEEDDIMGGKSSNKSLTNSEGALDAESASILWQDVTSSNSLAAVASLHCGVTMSKEERNLFVEATDRSLIMDNLSSLLSYCARDSLITLQVFQKVFPAFISSCPNPVTLAGVLGLGSAILPIDGEWTEYRRRSEEQYQKGRIGVRNSLVELAEGLREMGMKGMSCEYLEWAQEQKEKKLKSLREEMEGKEKQSTSKSKSTIEHADESLKPTNKKKKSVEMGKEELSQKEMRQKEFQTPWWENDPWTKQLDWSPKRPKRVKISISNSMDSSSDAAQESTSSTLQSLLPLLPGFRRVPKWYREALKGKNGLSPRSSALAMVLKLEYDGRLIGRDGEGNWISGMNLSDGIDIGGSPLRKAFLKSETKKNPDILKSSSSSPRKTQEVLDAIIIGDEEEKIRGLLTECAEEVVQRWEERNYAEMGDGLDWKVTEVKDERSTSSNSAIASSGAKSQEPEWWPKWYWDLFDAKTGNLDLTIRTRISPILLKISWRGNPLFHSREHGWVYRELQSASDKPSTPKDSKPLIFKSSADVELHFDSLDSLPAPSFYKVPHPSGDKSNVGSPFSKSFLSLFENEVLQSQHDDKGKEAAKNALEMNAQCSYWIGVRDRVAQQMVVWNGEAGTEMGFETEGESGFPVGRQKEDEAGREIKNGLILPQVVSMGTVTRRAIEKTWLTASNAKKNRVGSELKAMVKAPAGWNIVGADVDSEELWICSVMGDAQFGFHGATAVGWMTLEGTKSLGTDLHSKTASILGTSRNQAKVFNYSRIYGAGITHAKQLLMKADPNMLEDEAKKRAKDLYSKTKGNNSPQSEVFGNRRFWFGGTESYVFNKLEEIALSREPKTPALDCGVTAALSKKYLPKKTWDDGRRSEDYMPSRINWVVQSSGVDYLHLLICSMEHLCKAYGIEARFMLSVHDEVRYLCKEEDTDRVALALQISNLWTRAMFSHKLQIENLPQGCAFFALVDTDKVLRKEVDDPCVTPSHPDPIPSGKALDIEQTLKKTNNGSLHKDGRSMESGSLLPRPISDPSSIEASDSTSPHFPPYAASGQQHRSIGEKGLYFLQAQAASDIHEIRALERRARELDGDRFGPGIEGEIFAKSSTRKSSFPSKSSRRVPAQSRGYSTLTSEARGASRFSSTSTQTGHSNSSPSSSNSNSSSAILSPELTELLSLRPSTLDFVKGTVHRTPLVKTPNHNIQVRWGLYRNMMRSCDSLKKVLSKGPESSKSVQEVSLLKDWIKWKFQVSKNMTQKSLLLTRISKGNELLQLLEQATSGDQESRAGIFFLVSKIQAKRHKRMWENSIERFVESGTPVRIPHASGALLPATHFNVPLPRFKPTQPIEISMTVFNRRAARIKRGVKQAELSEMKRNFKAEAQFEENFMKESKKGKGRNGNEFRPSFKGDIGTWSESIRFFRASKDFTHLPSFLVFSISTPRQLNLWMTSSLRSQRVTIGTKRGLA